MQPFDKTEFAKILSTAKGNRSINQFGTACNVDPGYLSRLLRSLLNNPPSPAILAKIAAQAFNGVSYQDLMQAAGIIHKEDMASAGSESITFHMQKLLREMNTFFRLHSDLTDEEKAFIIQDTREYFQFKATQTRKKK